MVCGVPAGYPPLMRFPRAEQATVRLAVDPPDLPEVFRTVEAAGAQIVGVRFHRSTSVLIVRDHPSLPALLPSAGSLTRSR